MIKGVVFDCFGVLCHGSLDYLVSITLSERRQELKDLSRSSDYGYISMSDYLEQAGRLIGCSGKEVEAITRAKRIRNEDVIGHVRKIHITYKTAMLSNIGRGVIDGLFPAEELTELFDAVVLSNEVGMVKPDADIYELVASKLGLQPEECVMIDDIPANVSGAEAVGMRGILCSSTQQLITDLTTLLEKNRAGVA
jgi:FMN phosphatase YigB (HAD superfamily)